MFVVSANYRDRKSPYRWLIRELWQDHSEARAFKSVDATGVEFRDSDEVEQGFGCGTVAFCETAVGQEPELTDVTLRFDGLNFRDRASGNLVRKAETLSLGDDGSMEAVVRTAHLEGEDRDEDENESSLGGEDHYADEDELSRAIREGQNQFFSESGLDFSGDDGIFGSQFGEEAGVNPLELLNELFASRFGASPLGFPGDGLLGEQPRMGSMLIIVGRRRVPDPVW